MPGEGGSVVPSMLLMKPGLSISRVRDVFFFFCWDGIFFNKAGMRVVVVLSPLGCKRQEDRKAGRQLDRQDSGGFSFNPLPLP